MGEPANYGIDVSSWTPSSHEHSPYGAQILTPMYSDERTGPLPSSPAHRRPQPSSSPTVVAGDPAQKSKSHLALHSASPRFQHTHALGYPHPQYEQPDMQQAYANGYFPIMLGHTTSVALTSFFSLSES